MTYEVEKKFRIESANALIEKLKSDGAVFDPPVRQVDTYFSHPCRDFGETDEALRIRQVGQHHHITYKGPRIDRETKTRLEIEVPLGEGEKPAQQIFSVLSNLGFVRVGQVEKSRRSTRLSWKESLVRIDVDQVEQLGDFVELELMVEVFDSEESELEHAKQFISTLAEHLKLSDNVTTSYLELLMAGR